MFQSVVLSMASLRKRTRTNDHHCSVCLEATLEPVSISNGCQHVICVECIPSLFNAHLLDQENPNTQIVCPGERCSRAVMVNNLLDAMPEGVRDPLIKTFDRVEYLEQLRTLCLRSGQDACGTPLGLILTCYQCQWPMYVERTHARGVPSVFSCASCGALQCSGCRSAIGEESKHETCTSSSLYRPAQWDVDLGPLGTLCRPGPVDTNLQLSHLPLCVSEYLFQAINTIINDHLRGTKCPQCGRVASKGDACTQLRCETLGDSPGCGTFFCFCCGGQLARNIDEYVRLLKHPEQHTLLALAAGPVTKLTNTETHGLPRENDPSSYSSVMHNFGFELTFHPDVALPCGRCPNVLSALYRSFPWFTPSTDVPVAEREFWVLERWSQLQVLKALYRWFLTHHISVKLAEQLLSAPQAISCKMPFVLSWVRAPVINVAFFHGSSRGFLKPSCLLHYDRLNPMPFGYSDVDHYNPHTKRIWAKENLDLQRSCVAQVGPSPKIFCETEEDEWRSDPAGPTKAGSTHDCPIVLD